MTKGKRFLALGMAAILLTAGLAGCTKPAMKKITVAVDESLPPALLSGIYTAMETGLYDAARIQVELLRVKGASAAGIAAKGDANFSTARQEELGSLWSGEAPVPVTAVAAFTYKEQLGLLSDKKDGINTLKKMEGLKCAYTGSETQIAIMKAAMRWKDWNPEKVSFAKAPSEDAAQALKTNNGVIISRGWQNVKAYHSGVDNSIIDFDKQKQELTFYGPVLAANNDFLKNEPELARAFLHATTSGYDYTYAHRKETYSYLKKRHPEVDSSLLWDSFDQYCELFKKKGSHWGRIEQTQWKALFDFMYENQLLPKKLDAFGYINL